MRSNLDFLIKVYQTLVMSESKYSNSLSLSLSLLSHSVSLSVSLCLSLSLSHSLSLSLSLSLDLSFIVIYLFIPNVLPGLFFSFVARKSLHKFQSYQEELALAIENYSPIFHKDKTFDDYYYFNYTSDSTMLKWRKERRNLQWKSNQLFIVYLYPSFHRNDIIN